MKLTGKVCTKCKKERYHFDFHVDRSKKDGHHSICSFCHSKRNKEKRATDPEFVKRCRERSRQYRKDHPEKCRRGVRNATLKKKYGIGVDEYDKILREQRGTCAICDRTDSGVGHPNLHVDHNHKTGGVRGLLCQPCNTAIGMFRDKTALLKNAIAYLEKE